MQKLKDLWQWVKDSGLLTKTVTVPVKLIVIGCAVAFVLLVAGLVHKQAQPRVNAMLGLAQPAPVANPEVVAAARAIFAKLSAIEARLAKLEPKPKAKIRARRKGR